MKSINIDELEIKETNEKEKSEEFNIEISEYDADVASLEIEEDLTEKMISFIEKQIRSSYEYRQYIRYLKEELDLTKCALLPGIDCSEGAASLEFHHYPLNLYEITEVIGKQLIDGLSENEKVSTFEIAQRVMEEHFRGTIGLIPLTKTLHEMAHNKAIIIPISKVNGNYKKFVEKYSNYINQDIKDRIQDAEMNSESDDAKLYNASKLEKGIIKYNITYCGNGGTDEEV